MSDVTIAGIYSGPRTTALKLGPAPQLRVKSYCADCGTWDAHGPICATCGYDFTGAVKPTPIPPDEDDR